MAAFNSHLAGPSLRARPEASMPCLLRGCLSSLFPPCRNLSAAMPRVTVPQITWPDQVDTHRPYTVTRPPCPHVPFFTGLSLASGHWVTVTAHITYTSPSTHCLAFFSKVLTRLCPSLETSAPVFPGPVTGMSETPIDKFC